MTFLKVLVSINNLTVDDFVRILTEPDNAIVKQCKAQLAPVELQITDCALRRIAQLAIERGTGARGLNATMHALLREAKYEIPGSDIEAGKLDYYTGSSNVKYTFTFIPIPLKVLAE